MGLSVVKVEVDKDGRITVIAATGEAATGLAGPLATFEHRDGERVTLHLGCWEAWQEMVFQAGCVVCHQGDLPDDSLGLFLGTGPGVWMHQACWWRWNQRGRK